jgi:hypothetical protein
MKMMQQEGAFNPIALVLESEEDALRFWAIVNQYISVGGAASEGAYQMAVRISNWFSNEAKL